ncbi:MAG: DUF1499 domain-containing protein [Alphaproteobacteria bacterium]|nr:DUF1499 domain-containing protein [Alphaproteobacteria bacterium]
MDDRHARRIENGLGLVEPRMRDAAFAATMAATDAMFVRPTNPVSHRLARMAFIMACVAALIIASAGPLRRYADLDLAATFAIFRYGFYVAVAGIALGLATVVPTRPGDRRRGFVAALLAIVVGLAAAYMPLTWFLRAQHLPVLNDITTDIADPPLLVATLQLRRGAANPPAYPGQAAGAAQRAAYPDITSVVLPSNPADAFKKVDGVAMAMGWDVVARAPAEGRIEAVATSDWFGFRDDIVVRIRPDGTGSRIDIRSKSRDGQSDLGVNADRIREFTARLKAGG